MTTSKAASIQQFKLVSSFESLRKTLSQEKYADRLNQPLAYWALASDRRLPLALLGRTVGEILDTPFKELSSTPGIGQKKINSLVKLLARATREGPPAGSSELTESSKGQGESEDWQFDLAVVSESMWQRWRETVRNAGLENEKLGRLAPTLQSLPTVIWHSPLSTYLDYTLAEIRALKTHGEKRVRVILEVFYSIHQLFAGASPEKMAHHLTLRLTPKFTSPIQAWIDRTLGQPGIPDSREVRQSLSIPLLRQLRLDAGDNIADLAESRLGVNRPSESVRSLSRRIGVTRARIYQLLDECNKVMAVRWPEGHALIGALDKRFKAEADSNVDPALFKATAELFFPPPHEDAPESEERQSEPVLQ